MDAKRIEHDEGDNPIRGWLHAPSGTPAAALALTHGAGGNADAKLLIAIAESFAQAGFLVLRYDLPYRQKRPKGPPSGNGAADRAGIVAASEYLGKQISGPVYLSGQSYGGRLSSMAAAERQECCEGLLMLSYPLHPPGKPERLRTEHFPAIQVPVLFVHGTRDPFGSPAELESARKLLAGPSALHIIEGAGHGVPPGSAAEILEAFETLVSKKPAAKKK